ncbi:TIGR02996 domain-containing protein [Myxococcus landrumensis]|uniref:TIGR02996 domain-containing protein n=1 Tax=Myxococcus landrumensis TaxID=2813577 RepID=A0ABX7NG27_9BACT|nr:TIGR02996 domain-containing protein [Myxococcus landrumus]QSQ16321.1 TIGR02996 domain-containing protein [Myxococcus landrumus]
MSRRKAASNPELEAAIVQAPDAVDTYLVYGDWLQAQGDPRGELIALHHARTEASEFIHKHQRQLLGDELAGALQSRALELDWELGFIRAARVSPHSPIAEARVRQLVRELLRHPSGRFLRELSVGGISDVGMVSSYEAVTRLIVREGGSRTLQTLAYHVKQANEDETYCAIRLRDVSALYAVLPRLRSLDLRGIHARLGDIDLPELREFTLQTWDLSRSGCDSLLKAKWPKLERMEVWLGGDSTDAMRSVTDLTPLLDGASLPSLRRLGLRNTRWTDDLVRALHASPLLPRLTHLDLSGGTLSDDGAKWLSEHAAAFRHLQHLDLRGNTMSDAGTMRVEAVCPSVDTKNPRKSVATESG